MDEPEQVTRRQESPDNGRIGDFVRASVFRVLAVLAIHIDLDRREVTGCCVDRRTAGLRTEEAVRLCHQQWIDLIVRSRRHHAGTRGLPDDIATPYTPYIRPAEAGGRASSLNDVVHEHRVGCTESIRTAGLEVVAHIVDKRVESNLTVVRPVVARERSAVGDFSVTIADINAGAALEIVAKDLVAVTENPHTSRVAEIVAVDETFVAVPQREFASR